MIWRPNYCSSKRVDSLTQQSISFIVNQLDNIRLIILITGTTNSVDIIERTKNVLSLKIQFLTIYFEKLRWTHCDYEIRRKALPL